MSKANAVFMCLCVFHLRDFHIIPCVQAILGIEVVELGCKVASLSLQPEQELDLISVDNV